MTILRRPPGSMAISTYDPTGQGADVFDLANMVVASGTQGDMLARGAANWGRLPVGPIGEVVVSQGPGVDLAYARVVVAPAAGQGTSAAPITSGPHTSVVGARVIYDPTGGTFQINAPAAPTAGNRFGVKNASASITGVTLSGNGANIEDPTVAFALAASYSLSGNGVAVTWEYDGVAWLVV